MTDPSINAAPAAPPVDPPQAPLQGQYSMVGGDQEPAAQFPICDMYTNVVLGHTVAMQATRPQRCWKCNSDSRPEALFRPCQCAPIHRDCFREWRVGWINPSNYFQCPDCMRDYNIERVKPSSVESEARIWRRFRFDVAKVWFATFLVLGILIAAIALIAYYSDRSRKNIPVGVKYMLSSVVNGFPTGNSTAVWREEFKRPDVFVWQYYTLLACLIASVVILIGFSILGCTFDEKERERKGNCQCCGDCCGRSNNDSMMWCIYCNSANCNVTNCKSPDCGGGGGCDNEGAAILVLVIIIIVAIAVLLSAIFVVILYACQKWALLYDRVASMLKAQAAELEGETIVLGINEQWRPVDQV